MEEQVEEEEQQPLAPPSQLPAPSPSSTNHSVVDMELTCLSPNPTHQPQTWTLTAPCPSSMHIRKRSLEPEEEENGGGIPASGCQHSQWPPRKWWGSPPKRSRLATLKHPEYEPVSGGPSTKRSAPCCEEELDFITWSLTNEEERLNLALAQCPTSETSPRTLSWTPGTPLQPRMVRHPQNVVRPPPSPWASSLIRVPPLIPRPDYDLTKINGSIPTFCETKRGYWSSASARTLSSPSEGLYSTVPRAFHHSAILWCAVAK